MNTYTEQHAISYHSEIPAWLGEFCAVPEMQRPMAFRSLRFKARTSPLPLRTTR